MVVNLPLTLPRLPALRWSPLVGADGAKDLTLPRIPLGLLAAAPVVLPVAYAACVLYRCARRTTATARIKKPGDARSKSVKKTKAKTKTEKANHEIMEVDEDDLAIPPSVLAEADEKYVILRERIVSEAVSVFVVAELGQKEKEKGKGREKRGILEKYLSETMRLFTYTPQAYLMKTMVSRLRDGAKHADTFSPAYLAACAFRPGDRVCGVYVVTKRERQRVVLELSPPEGWTGPKVTGALDCGFVVQQQNQIGDGAEDGNGNGKRTVRFFNETVMWRRLDEKPSLLEGALGRALHTLMVRWMVARGVDAVVADENVRAS